MRTANTSSPALRQQHSGWLYHTGVVYRLVRRSMPESPTNSNGFAQLCWQQVGSQRTPHADGDSWRMARVARAESTFCTMTACLLRRVIWRTVAKGNVFHCSGVVNRWQAATASSSPASARSLLDAQHGGGHGQQPLIVGRPRVQVGHLQRRAHGAMIRGACRCPAPTGVCGQSIQTAPRAPPTMGRGRPRTGSHVFQPSP